MRNKIKDATDERDLERSARKIDFHGLLSIVIGQYRPDSFNIDYYFWL